MNHTSGVYCAVCVVLCVCVRRELEADKEALQLRVTEVTVANERLKSRVEELEERVRVYMGGEGEEVEGGRGSGGCEGRRQGGGWEGRWRIGKEGEGVHGRGRRGGGGWEWRWKMGGEVEGGSGGRGWEGRVEDGRGGGGWEWR